jgi:hypothetical protein
MSADNEDYSTIRDNDLLGPFIGKRIVAITQHDEDEYAETQQAYVMLMFEDGTWVKFFIGEDGFVLGNEDGEEDVEAGE